MHGYIILKKYQRRRKKQLWKESIGSLGNFGGNKLKYQSIRRTQFMEVDQ